MGRMKVIPLREGEPAASFSSICFGGFCVQSGKNQENDVFDVWFGVFSLLTPVTTNPVLFPDNR